MVRDTDRGGVPVVGPAAKPGATHAAKLQPNGPYAHEPLAPSQRDLPESPSFNVPRAEPEPILIVAFIPVVRRDPAEYPEPEPFFAAIDHLPFEPLARGAIRFVIASKLK